MVFESAWVLCVYDASLTGVIITLYRKRGIIVNLSSGSCLFPLPLLAVYAATKVTDHMMQHDLFNLYTYCYIGFHILFHFSSSI